MDDKIPNWKQSRKQFLDNLKQQRKIMQQLAKDDEIIIILDNNDNRLSPSKTATAPPSNTIADDNNSCRKCGQKFSSEVLARHEIFCCEQKNFQKS